MNYEMPVKCPVCGGGFHVKRLGCSRCNSVLDGSFELDRLSLLPSEMKQFIVAFLKCRGNIREMEKLLGISYPTVRTRIDDIVASLGETCTAATEAEDMAADYEYGEGGLNDGSGGGGSTAGGGSSAKDGNTGDSLSRPAILKMLAAGEIDTVLAHEMLTKLAKNN